MAQRRGLDPNALQRIRDDLSRGLNDTKPIPPDDATEFVRPSFIASGHDTGPYPVGNATEYYQGPHLSTRVAAHSFMPLDENGMPWANRSRQELVDYRPQQKASGATYGGNKISDTEHGPYGYVFVRWQKAKKNGSIATVYGTTQLIPLSVYRVFRDYYSKGRAVVHMLEQYGYEDADVLGDLKRQSGVMDV